MRKRARNFALRGSFRRRVSLLVTDIGGGGWKSGRQVTIDVFIVVVMFVNNSEWSLVV
jgi:hypothetical protein